MTLQEEHEQDEREEAQETMFQQAPIDRKLTEARNMVASLFENVIQYIAGANQALVTLQEKAATLGLSDIFTKSVDAIKETQAVKVGQAMYEAMDEVQMALMGSSRPVPEDVYDGDEYTGPNEEPTLVGRRVIKPKDPVPRDPRAGWSPAEEDVWVQPDAEPAGQDPAYNREGETLPEDMLPDLLENEVRPWYQKYLGIAPRGTTALQSTEDFVQGLVGDMYGDDAATAVLQARRTMVELQPIVSRRVDAAVKLFDGQPGAVEMSTFDRTPMPAEVMAPPAQSSEFSRPARGYGGHMTVAEIDAAEASKGTSLFKRLTSKLGQTFKDTASALSSKVQTLVKQKLIDPGVIKLTDLVAPDPPRIELQGLDEATRDAVAAAEQRNFPEGVPDSIRELRRKLGIETYETAGRITDAPAEYATAGEGTATTLQEAMAKTGTSMPDLKQMLNKVGEKTGLGEYMNVDMEGQVGLNTAKLKEFLTSSAKGIALTPFLVGLGLLLDEVDPNINKYLVTGLTVVEFVSSGNPLGLAMLGLAKVYEGWQDVQRKHEENLLPQRQKGMKFGYIRKGNRWFPAALDLSEHDEGFFSDKNMMQMNFGDALYFKNVSIDGAPTLQAFTEGSLSRHKQFHVSDEEFSNEQRGSYRGSSKRTVDTFDKLRNWYFLSDTEVESMMKDPANFTMEIDGSTDPPSTIYRFKGMAAYDEESSLSKGNPYEQQLDDWRLVTEMMHVDPSMNATESVQADTFDVTKELRDKINDGNFTSEASVRGGSSGMAQLMSGDSGEVDPDDWMFNTTRAMGYDNDDFGFAGLDTDGYYHKMNETDDFHRGSQPENDWLMNTFFWRQVVDLQNYQMAAAEEAHFDDRYGFDPYLQDRPDYKYPTSAIGNANFSGKMGNPIWASLYIDTSHSRDTAWSYDELKTQLDEIGTFEDRSPTQQRYLRQKATTRYWLNQIGLRGGSSTLLHKMVDKAGPAVNEISEWKSQLLAPSFDYDRVMDTWEDGWHPEDDPSTNDIMYNMFKPMEELNGWIMPWQNAGDEGIFGDTKYAFTGNYQEMYDRFSGDAAANVAWYIKSHGAVDPNMLLDGVQKNMVAASGDWAEGGGHNGTFDPQYGGTSILGDNSVATSVSKAEGERSAETFQEAFARLQRTMGTYTVDPLTGVGEFEQEAEESEKHRIALERVEEVRAEQWAREASRQAAEILAKQAEEQAAADRQHAAEQAIRDHGPIDAYEGQPSGKRRQYVGGPDFARQGSIKWRNHYVYDPYNGYVERDSLSDSVLFSLLNPAKYKQAWQKDFRHILQHITGDMVDLDFNINNLLPTLPPEQRERLGLRPYSASPSAEWTDHPLHWDVFENRFTGNITGSYEKPIDPDEAATAKVAQEAAAADAQASADAAAAAAQASADADAAAAQAAADAAQAAADAIATDAAHSELERKAAARNAKMAQRRADIKAAEAKRKADAAADAAAADAEAKRQAEADAAKRQHDAEVAASFKAARAFQVAADAAAAKQAEADAAAEDEPGPVAVHVDKPIFQPEPPAPPPVTGPLHVDRPSDRYVEPFDPVPEPDKTPGFVSGLSTHAVRDTLGLHATHVWVAPALDTHLQSYYESMEAGLGYHSHVTRTQPSLQNLQSYYQSMHPSVAAIPPKSALTKVV